MRILKTGMLLGALLWSGQLYSQSGDLLSGVSRCAKIDNDIGRLQCFDGVANSYFSSAAKAEKALKNWRVGSKVDPISDRVTTILSLDSAADGQSFYGGANRHRLVLRCSNRTLEVLIVWASPSEAPRPKITSRIGEAPATTEIWIPSNNSKITFYPNDDHELFYKLLQEKQFVARLYRGELEGKDLTGVFDISGLDEASKSMISACPPRKPLTLN